MTELAPRFLLVDDHPLIRHAVRQILMPVYPTAVFEEAGDGESALAFLRANPCDLLVLDLGLTGMGGLEVLDRITRQWPKLPVVVLTMHDESHFALKAIKQGARAFVNKGLEFEHLLAAVRKVLAGGMWISETLSGILLAQGGVTPDPLPHTRLSPREFRVMTLLAKGMPLTEIAGQLALNAKTVSTYRQRILEKLHLKTNADLTRYCLEARLIH